LLFRFPRQSLRPVSVGRTGGVGGGFAGLPLFDPLLLPPKSLFSPRQSDIVIASSLIFERMLIQFATLIDIGKLNLGLKGLSMMAWIQNARGVRNLLEILRLLADRQ